MHQNINSYNEKLVCNYNPSTGRFLSEDPIGFASGDTNLYRYVSNRPIEYLDPDGRLAISGSALLIGGAIGAVSGGVSAYLSGGDISAILTGAAIGAGAGVASVLVGAASLGAGAIAGFNGLIGAGTNLAGQLLDKNRCTIDIGSIAISGFAGSLGAFAGMGAANNSFFNNPVINNTLVNINSPTLGQTAGAVVGGAVGGFFDPIGQLFWK
jgi:hypothetical protein